MSNRKVIRLLEPEMCLECRFGHKVMAKLSDDTEQCMINCTRGDCDNWAEVLSITATETTPYEN